MANLFFAAHFVFSFLSLRNVQAVVIVQAGEIISVPEAHGQHF